MVSAVGAANVRRRSAISQPPIRAQRLPEAASSISLVKMNSPMASSLSVVHYCFWILVFSQ